jgi:MFS family permease
MRSSRVLVAIILFPLLAMVDGLASSGARTILPRIITAPRDLGGLGSSPTAVGSASLLLAGIGLLAPLVGGATATAVGARRLLVLGTALAVIACAALAFATPGSLTMIVVLMALAGALFFVNLYAVVAEQLTEARPMTLAALFAGLSVAANIGSFGGGFGSVFVGSGLGGSPSSSGFLLSLLLDAVLMALVTGALAVAFALDRGPAAPRPGTPKPARALLLLAAVTVPLCLIANLQKDLSPTPPDPVKLALHYGVAAGVQLLVLAAFITLAAVGSRAPLLILLGGGLLASALGGALSLGGFDVMAPVLGNLGRHVAVPPTLALIAAVTPRRYAPVVFALWMTWDKLWTALSSLGGTGAPAWVVAVGTLGCVVAGAALLARGRSLDASRFSAPVAAPGSA